MHGNASSLEEQGASHGGAAVQSPTDITANVEPFVQIASWGHGKFHPLMKVTSAGLSLEDGGQYGDNGERNNRKAIHTRAGGLEIAPAAGEKQHVTL